MLTDQKRGYAPFYKMRDLLRDNAMLLPAFSRFGIAFGFGEGTIADVCNDNNVDIDTFITVCNLLSGYQFDSNRISLPSLMGYLKRAHTAFLDIELPKIRKNLINAIGNPESDEVASLLIKFFDEYALEVRGHMEYENDVVFAYVDQLLAGDTTHDFNISKYSGSHSDTVTKLNELKDIFINHYSQKDNMRLSDALLDIIICGRDLMSHFEVESKILIPSVEQLESNLKSKQSVKQATVIDTKEVSPQLQILSDREKDIIREVALGKVNKEIAEDLCISINTVTTHRRNICCKLDIHTSAGLTVFAIINHLVDLNEAKLS